MAAAMTGLEKFKATVRISKYIDRNLESLARVVEGTENRNATYNTMLMDLKALYPGEDAELLAQELITEQCRVEFLKLKDALKAGKFSSQR
jgi:hypothetical protein